MRLFDRSFTVALAAVALLMTLPAPAAAQSPIEMTSVALTERAVRKADGTMTREKVTVKTAIPGDEVVFVNRFRNVGDKPAANLVLTNPLPDHTRLKEAYGNNSAITYSVDGGKHFDVAEKLTVALPDGKSRPAAKEDYTHIRWHFPEAVPPGQSGEVGFRVAVK